MLKRSTLLAVLLLAAGCHDGGKDRGTCIETMKVGTHVYEQCIVNEARELCSQDGIHPQAAFTLESLEAGRSRCAAGGYTKLDRIARWCDGSPSEIRMDTSGNWEANPSMVETAISKHCALEYQKPDLAK